MGKHGESDPKPSKDERPPIPRPNSITTIEKKEERYRSLPISRSRRRSRTSSSSGSSSSRGREIRRLCKGNKERRRKALMSVSPGYASYVEKEKARIQKEQKERDDQMEEQRCRCQSESLAKALLSSGYFPQGADSSASAAASSGTLRNPTFPPAMFLPQGSAIPLQTPPGFASPQVLQAPPPHVGQQVLLGQQVSPGPQAPPGQQVSPGFSASSCDASRSCFSASNSSSGTRCWASYWYDFSFYNRFGQPPGTNRCDYQL